MLRLFVPASLRWLMLRGEEKKANEMVDDGRGVCEHLIGVEAAGKGLEAVSKPLQSST